MVDSGFWKRASLRTPFLFADFCKMRVRFYKNVRFAIAIYFYKVYKLYTIILKVEDSTSKVLWESGGLKSGETVKLGSCVWLNAVPFRWHDLLLWWLLPLAVVNKYDWWKHRGVSAETAAFCCCLSGSGCQTSRQTWCFDGDGGSGHWYPNRWVLYEIVPFPKSSIVIIVY